MSYWSHIFNSHDVNCIKPSTLNRWGSVSNGAPIRVTLFAIHHELTLNRISSLVEMYSFISGVNLSFSAGSGGPSIGHCSRRNTVHLLEYFRALAVSSTASPGWGHPSAYSIILTPALSKTDLSVSKCFAAWLYRSTLGRVWKSNANSFLQ